MLPLRNLLVAGVVLLVVCPLGALAQRSHVNPSQAGSDSGPPFSGAVLAGETLYLSGMLGLEDGQVPDDPAREARNVLNAFQETLAEAGMTMDDLVYVQVFCADLSLYGTFNDVYRTFFTEEFPARAFIGAGSLLFGARFEIQGIAVRR